MKVRSGLLLATTLFTLAATQVGASANAVNPQGASTPAQVRALTASQTGNITSTAHTATQATGSSSAVVNLALKLANSHIPYVWGGESLSGMDCSGLTDYVYQQAGGTSLGHYTVTQESHVTKKSVAAAQPGDLLFWGAQGASYHVAIYVGDNQYVAAPAPGQNVEVETINSAFMPSFAGTVNR